MNSGPEQAVSIVVNERSGRVDVRAGGDPFTSYVYDTTERVLAKPVLHPIRSPAGNRVTRGYPLDSRSGERTDHPHHVGHWLNYDPVNGVNFWANAGPETDERWEPLGSIRHRDVVETTDGSGRGELVVRADWVGPDGPLLREETEFVFRAFENNRTIDRRTTLTAVGGPVSFEDSKEGLFALRVAAELEHPARDPITVVDDPTSGTTTEIAGTAGRTGEYLSGARVRGRDVWGTRAEWLRLAGEIDCDPVAVTIFDHPGNPGYPTYWMARGYGLFAANPLGQAVYSDGESELGLELGPNESATFRYRMAIDERIPSPAELDDRATEFNETYPE